MRVPRVRVKLLSYNDTRSRFHILGVTPSIRIADRRGFWKATMSCKSYSIEEPWLREV